MFVARMVCSDEACAQEHVAEVVTPAELDALACACGCTFQVLGWPDHAEEVVEPCGAQVIAFPRARVRAWDGERLAS